MLIIKTKRFEWWNCGRSVGVGMALSLLSGIVSVVFSVNALAAVVEFYNPDLNNYFITAVRTTTALPGASTATTAAIR